MVHGTGESRISTTGGSEGVPSDGADKGGVSPLLLVEGFFVSDTFLEVADHRISLMQEGIWSRSLELIWARGQRSVSEG